MMPKVGLDHRGGGTAPTPKPTVRVLAAGDVPAVHSTVMQ